MQPHKRYTLGQFKKFGLFFKCQSHLPFSEISEQFWTLLIFVDIFFRFLRTVLDVTLPQLISSHSGSEPLHFCPEYVNDTIIIIFIAIIIIIIAIVIINTLSVPHMRVPFPTIMKPYLHSYETCISRTDN